MQASVYGVYKSGVVELEEMPIGIQEGNKAIVVFFENTSNKISLEDFFKLRGKYSGKMSVDKFLEQKRKDIELER
jgi:tRNA threonylcarbamoyladenosine modification (KEOPS) complex Cgi121 subunit